MRLLVTLLLIAAFALGAALSYYNWNPVSFHYLAGQLELPLIALLLSAFLLGVAVAFLLNLARFWSLRRETRRLRKQLDDAEAELKSLRNLPLGADRAKPPAPGSSGAVPLV
jgi:putative membrane protein